MHARARKGGRTRAESQRGGTEGLRRLLLRVKVVSNIESTESSVHVASAQGLERHHPIIEHSMGTRRPGQKKGKERNTHQNHSIVKLARKYYFNIPFFRFLF